ncbi:hypothetical protein HZF24_00645 [Sedimentibacter hydroxybenzoicus DSM 7310]|uniref:Uncharacterized protein n=1 Tax=Sedimentibacter hydroxybenzoicus DSM 7310 TaxID=1123245 RepID=A0A974BGH4_SEDHY|nr:hypothetical protein [Sedimentibacter hydroxybenzoicus]NYB72642.1 hypothetical protein [Sedimentibacter hydroxybenzoicus DSM 7310]
MTYLPFLRKKTLINGVRANFTDVQDDREELRSFAQDDGEEILRASSQNDNKGMMVRIFVNKLMEY